MQERSRTYTTPVGDGTLPLVDRGDADLPSEEEARYAAESDRYVMDGPPARVVEAFEARRRGRPPIGEHASGPSPRIGVRLPATTRDAVRDAAGAEGVSEAEWLRAAIEERLRGAPRKGATV